jgi:peptidoglycan hydrolase-like protein with peptidoglycan-binding domain
MKTFVQRFVNGVRTTPSTVGLFMLGGIVVLGLTTPAFAYTTINSQLDMGESNSDVTSLQTFFRDNSSIYPSGLVTGYFGSLTKAGVIRFQSLYGFDQVGRVGPITRDKINALINSGGWNGVSTGSDVSGPGFSNIYQSQNSNSATFSFNTDELTTARVAYYTSPLMFTEGDITSAGFGPIGGLSTYSPNGSSRSHSVTITNLSSNSIYYYTIIVTDAAGNVSVWGPNNALRTNTQ